MKTKLFSALATSVLLFASCSNDDNNTPEINDGRVKFSSGVSATTDATTRVGGVKGDQWEGDESIGIYMIGHTDLQIKEDAQNIEYSTLSIGTEASFSPVNTTKTIYYPVNDPLTVDFIAYHPFNTAMVGYEYPIDLSNQSDQSALDLMVAKTTTGYDKTNTSAINLGFNHQLVKVEMKVEMGEGVTSLDGLSVQIKGMNTTATFDIFGAATFTNIDNILNITPYKQSSAYVYEAILLPVTLDSSHIVEFTAGGNTYVWEMRNNDTSIGSLTEGKKYTFTVELKKNGVSVNGSIVPWSNIAVGGTAQ